MPNIGTVLRDEVVRLARRVVKADTHLLRRQSVAHRHAIAQLRRQVASLEQALKRAQRRVPGQVSSEDGETPRVRFSAAALRATRKRWGLSGEQLARLLGVSSQALYFWETGKNRPRGKSLARWAELRALGKRAIAAQLEAASRPSTRRHATPRRRKSSKAP